MVSSSSLNQANELNLFSLPLTGRSLIEASAGTGKTYSLAFIYLRLLLGIGDNNYPKPLSIEQILVVTFTKAATEELRYRIRQNIHQLRMACISGSHPDKDYQQLIELIDDKPQALKHLLYAEQNMDEAAIFTIHGFCQRMLTTYAFESGILFKQTLVKDERDLYLHVINDFWRHYFTPMPEDIAIVIWQNWADPKALLADIARYLNQPLPHNIPPSGEPLSEKITRFHHDNILKIETIKRSWLASVGEINDIILQSDVNKRSYSKRNLPTWLTTISDWAQSDSTSITKTLIKFSQTELNSKTDLDKVAPIHPLFTEITQFLQHDFSLRNAILFDIIHIINQQMNHEKTASAQIGFNDLLTTFNQALQGPASQKLVEQIMQQYPVAMIDEFQDTDQIQYQIFDQIYQDRKQTGLLLIGDPKQAIYGFRGADIFTYIKAKSSVDQQFTMLTNWRSTSAMVAGVNSLFSRVGSPFVFDAIPFITMKSAEQNAHKGFYVEDQEVAAMSSYLLPESITSKEDYLDYAADYCAEKISQWLATDAYFYHHEQEKKRLQSSDIAILVRTGREAEIIQQKLNKRNIKSVYVSNHKSVFESLQAREVLRILSAVLSPTNESHIRSALATQLIGASMGEIDRLSDDQNSLESVIEEFRDYQQIWFRYGVLVMLRRLMNRRHLTENILSLFDGERIITNFMHLGELLQEVAQDIDTPHALIRWLSKQINEPDRNLENHEQRLESDENLITIVTIHKSKGLEYPIVFLPFIGAFRESDSQIYHERKNYQLNYAYTLTPEIKDLIEQERLAEDLRLLYVALTRSIYHCSFALAGLKKTQANELSLKQSAIGYLLLDAVKPDYASLQDSLKQLAKTNVVNVELPIPFTVLKKQQILTDLPLMANQFRRKLDMNWRVTSYSGLLQSSDYENNRSAALLSDIQPSFDIEVLADNQISEEQFGASNAEQAVYDIHHFPKGAIVGTLLHECFENCDFEQPDMSSFATHLITKLNLDNAWQQPLSEWISGVLQAKLSTNLTLSSISRQHRLDELQFYLPIKHEVTASDLDHLSKQYDDLSKQCEVVNFTTIQGMLKGFIDMIFEHQGKYYIVDYKSNYLGESINDYNVDAISQAMCEHRYDLQYQLYTLALHRYLKSRLTHYHYQTHFGGVYYLFIRGMSANDCEHGIFYTKPEHKFIDALDKLFGQ